MQTVLLTGANGFIGYYLTRQLLQQSYKVIATGKGSNRLPFVNDNLIYEPLDFTNEEEVKTLLAKYKPHCIIHSGAISKPDECEINKEAAYHTNVNSTEYLLTHAAINKSFFVFISTDFVFSGDKEFYTEADERLPVNYYGHTKVLAENLVMQYAYGWSIVRTVLVYGNPASGRHNILTNTAAALQRGGLLNIFTDQTRTPTYVEDLVQGIVSIVDGRKEGVYHLSGEDKLSPFDMACAVADYLHLDKSKITGVTEAEFKQPARRPPRTVFDLSKAKNELQYKTTSFAEGLKKTFTDV